MILLTTLLALFLTWSVTVPAPLESQKSVYPDPESFKSELIDSVIVKETSLDINSDGEPDILIYSTSGEEILLDILRATQRLPRNRRENPSFLGSLCLRK